jgi:hypothetical protein
MESSLLWVNLKVKSSTMTLKWHENFRPYIDGVGEAISEGSKWLEPRNKAMDIDSFTENHSARFLEDPRIHLQGIFLANPP